MSRRFLQTTVVKILLFYGYIVVYSIETDATHNELKCEKKIQISNVCVWLVAGLLPQRLKSMFLNRFLHSGSTSGTLHSKKFQKTLILAFEAYIALSCQNELFSRFSLL